MVLTTPPKPKTKQQKQNLARQIARQIVQEPIEIIKTAGEQVAGQAPRQEGKQQQQESQEQPQTSVLEQKKDARMRALTYELQEISQNKEREGQLKKQEEERAKQQIEVNKQREQQVIKEPSTKEKRGMFGGIGLKRKQRQVELVKTPSN